MNHIDVDAYDPANKPIGETAHMLVRAAIGAMPIGSGTVLEAWNLIVEDPYQKRRTKWMRDLSTAINDVNDRVEAIMNNSVRQDAVLSAILQSTDLAFRTGDATIHRKLIAIVLNTINEQEPNEELMSLYLSTIRQLTASHLELLTLISTRQRYEKGTDLDNHELMFFKEIDDRHGISPNIPKNRLLKDLESLSLIYSPEGSPGTLGGSTNYCTMAVTPFGSGFAGFISDPH